uniref:C-type lectin domain-containing protein n=1 Tax=Mola mola TaxID=94237 RepID=A0A3Q3W9Q9_MOLML
MSLAFRNTPREVEEGSWNLMAADNRSMHGWQSHSSVCWIGAAVVGLYTTAINEWDNKYKDVIYEITKGRDDVRDERDQLKITANNLTQEIQALQDQYVAVVASRDELQAEVNRLSLNRTDNPCHLGWKKFNKKCYYVSSNGVSKTWANSRKDCQERGADLVIITTKEELDFVKKSYSVTWIGLSRGQGGGWTWVDGTDLEGEGFWQDDEPNNADGNENCVEVSRDMAAWNDVPCSRKFSWVCEELDRVRSHSSLSSQN